MQSSYPILVGIDIGTTNLKLVAAQPGGRLKAVVRRPMSVDRPSVGAAEFNLPALRSNLIDGLAELRQHLSDHGVARIAAIAVASIGESFVGLSAEGDPVTPCPTWYDRRTANSRAALGFGADEWFDITGMVDDDIYTVHRLAWWRSYEPDRIAAVRRWLMVSDYATYLLSGAFASSPSLAARSGLADRKTGQWSETILSAAALSADKLPSLLPSASVAGQLSGPVARETGLKAGTPIINAGHDHPCAGLGCGLAEPGDIIDSTGTSEAIKTVLARPLAYGEAGNGAYDCYPHAVPGRFLLSGHTPASGGFLDWLVARLSGPKPSAETADLLWEMARKSPAGACGLRLTPFLEGTGAPWNDRKRRSSFNGIGAEAQTGDILRAGVESLATWLKINLQSFTSLAGLSPRRLVVTGGGARNDLANEIKAAMTGLSLALPDVGEAAGLGAALVAGIAVGAYADADDAARLPDISWRTVTPDPTLVTAYASLLPTMKAALKRGRQ